MVLTAEQQKNIASSTPVEFDLESARFDVHKFGIKGFEKSKYQDARVALAVGLGAKVNPRTPYVIGHLHVSPLATEAQVHQLPTLTRRESSEESPGEGRRRERTLSGRVPTVLIAFVAYLGSSAW